MVLRALNSSDEASYVSFRQHDVLKVISRSTERKCHRDQRRRHVEIG
jgi:hypothetical protein